MKEIIAWTVNVWRMYWGNGWIPYLLALGGACALIFGKKKKNSLSLVLYSVFPVSYTHLTLPTIA